MKIILPKSKILAVFLFFAVFLFGSTAFGQTTGDYRSIATGNWTNRLNWQYYNGSTWVTPTGTSPQGYPGEFAGTGTVTIQGTFEITLNTNVPNSFTSLVIGGSGSGKLIVGSSITVQTSTVTMKSNGTMVIGGNNTITFPANTSFGIESGAVLEGSGSPCSNNTAIYIGVYKVSACNGSGGGALSNFGDFTTRGGNGSATSNSPVCNGSSLTLTAHPPVPTSGGPYTYTYKWSGPGIASPTVSSSPIYTISNAGSGAAGLYTVEMKDGSFTTEASTTVVISPTPVGGGVNNGNTPICLNSSTGNMTLGNGYVGNVVRWEKKLSTDSSWTPISNTSTVYSENPSVAGTWQYRAVVGSGACPVVYSTPFSVVVNPALTISLVSNNASGCQNSSNAALSYTSITGNANLVYLDFSSAAVFGSNMHQVVPVSAGPGTITIQYNWGAAPGTYNGVLTVVKDTQTPNCTSSTTYPISLTISSSTTPITISNNPIDSAICVGANTSFAVVASTGVLSYQWQVSTNGGGLYTNLSNGGVYSNVTTATMNITGATAGMANYKYRCIVNGCAGSVNSNAATLTFTPTVGTPSTPTPSATTICQGSSNTTYTTSATNATSYNWTVSGAGNTISGTGTTGTVTWAAGFSGGATISVAAVGCGTSSTVSTTVTVNPTQTLTSAIQTIFACYSSPATIKLTGLLQGSTSTVSYSIGGGAEAPITNVTADGAGEASFDTRVLTSGDDGEILQITGLAITSASPTCSKSFAGITLTLNVKPNSGGISLNGGTPIASGGNTTFSEKTSAIFSITPVPGATGYTWIVPTGWNITAGTGTNQITVTTGTENQGGNVTVTANNMLCPSSLNVTLTSIAPPAPTPNAVIPVTCSALGSISFNNLPAGSWTLDVIKDGASIGTISGAGNSYTAGSLTSGTYTFTVSDIYGTSLASATVLIEAVTKTWKTVGSVTGWYIGTTPSAVPTLDDIAVFEADYNGPDSIQACSCTVKTGVNVTIAGEKTTAPTAIGKVLTVVNGVHVQTGGTLTFANGASLIQNSIANNLNTGSIIYQRTVSPIKDFDYVYWSSPVKNQALGALFPQSDKYWSWKVNNWLAGAILEEMIEGKGYIARVPRYVTSQTVNFIGTPNNGNITIGTQGFSTKNLIGNPYPSAVDAELFMIANQNTIEYGGMLAFWTHTSSRKLNNAGNLYEYIAADYAYFNMTGGVATDPTDPMDPGGPTGIPAATGGPTPNGTIGAGQSFFVGSDVEIIDGTTGEINNVFKFTNSMRIGNDGENSQFFKQANTKKTAKIEKNRIWLNLTNSGGAFKQLLVGYITGATNDADKLFDGTTRNSNAFVDFYSVINEKKYTIQGRGLPFDEADEVPLGYRSTIEGTFQISIDKTDGFLTNQAVYLEDKTTNVIHDLTKGSYSFTTAKGEFKDRFVLRYTNTSKLGTGDFDPKGKGVIVSVKNSQIKINSFDQIISKAMVYDLKGSLLFEKSKVDKNEFIIDHLSSGTQFMIVMIQLEDGKWVSEEIIFHD
jgi:hypothetical protein